MTVKEEGKMTVLHMKSGLCAAFIAAVVFLAPSAAAAPPGDMPFGAYDPDGVFSDDTGLQIEHLFLPWEDVFLGTLIEADGYAHDRGREVLVTIEPWTWTRDARNTPQVLINGIRTGQYDFNMLAICSILSGFESPVTVRWAQEMEDKSGQFIWANWEPSVYINAFRRVINICRSVAPDVRVMWSPLGYEGLEAYYPGDNYVDVVGLSVFGLQDWERSVLGRELTFTEILGPRYARAAQFGKPVMVAELGYVGDEAYVNAWENTVRQDYADFPNLIGVVYFNQKEVHPWPDGFGFPDWKVAERITR